MLKFPPCTLSPRAVKQYMKCDVDKVIVFIPAT